MELADELTHTVMAYIAAVARNGVRLSSADVETYALHPGRLPELREYTGLRGVLAGSAMARESLLGASAVKRQAEGAVAYLLRVRWAAVDGGNISLTPVGRAVLSFLNRPPIEYKDDEPVSVVIDPRDPLAYVKLFEFIASRERGMLVDPHLGPKELFDIADIAEIDRVLIADRDIKKKRALLARTLGALSAPPELRYLPAKELHDRFFIPDEGDILMFGTSLNSITSRPGIVTPIADSVAGKATRESYESAWQRATAISPEAPPILGESEPPVSVS